MVFETVAEREKTAEAVFTALGNHNPDSMYADDIALELEKAKGIDIGTTLWTIWRLIDENRLKFSEVGHLRLVALGRGE